MNTESLYSLMIKAHKLSKQNFDVDALPALRDQAQQSINLHESSVFLGNFMPHKSEVVPVLALDEQMARPFGWSFIDKSFNVTTECLQAGRDLICLATFDAHYQLAKSGRLFVIRFGFFTHESDVLESRFLGFDGLTIHADMLDLFEMQYLVEVCRDYRMSCILVVSNQQALEVALQSDCPYIAVWGYQPTELLFKSDFAGDALAQFPKTCVPILFAPALPKANLQLWQSRGYKVIFQP